MIKIENIDVYGWEPAVRGMRNPKNSWVKCDSGVCATHGPAHCVDCVYTDCHADDVDISIKYILGPNDLNLMTTLCNAGADHSKFMRMIMVYLDITAPLYWWKEFDTYKVGTVANSCSTMHKIHSKEFTLDDFSCEHLMDDAINAKYDLDGCGAVICLNGISAYTMFVDTVAVLNAYRKKYLETKDKRYWWQMIQLLPSSYNQKRTVLLNYQVLKNMYFARKNHRLDEWRTFCEEVEKLPYFKEICIEPVSYKNC